MILYNQSLITSLPNNNQSMQQSQKITMKKQPKATSKASKNKKKVDLSKEFDEFKLRIQSFENKNEEIIKHIRNAYAQKKKAIQNTHPNSHLTPPPIFYDSHEPNSIDSDDYPYPIDEQLRRRTLAQNPHHPAYYDQNSLNYKSTAQFHRQRDTSNNQRSQPSVDGFAKKTARNPTPKQKQPPLIKYEDYMRNAQLTNRSKTEDRDYSHEQIDLDNNLPARELKRTAKFANNDSGLLEFKDQLQESVMRNLQLEEELQLKELQVQRIRSIEIRFKSYANNVKHIIEDQLQNYHETVLAQKLIQIDKYLKKFENRLKNVSLRLKDALDDRQTNRQIRDSRQKRRAISISKATKYNSLLSLDMRGSWVEPNRTRSIAPSPKRNSEASSKQQQFQKIAAGYETMIKTKTDENEKLQKQLREQSLLKESATSETQKLKAILDERQKQMGELRQTDKQGGKDEKDIQLKNMKELTDRMQEQLRAKQTKQQELEDEITKLERTKKNMQEDWSNNHTKNLESKNTAITQLETKLKQLQHDHELELTALKQKLAQADCRNMEKQCELLSLGNKAKKAESQCRFKEQKINELETLLLKQNERGDNLERSICLDSSAYSPDVRSLQQIIRKLDEQIQDKTTQIYELQKQKYLQENQLKANEAETDKLLKTKTQAEQRANLLLKQLEHRKEEQNDKDNQRFLAQKNQLIQEFQNQRDQLILQKLQLFGKNDQLLEELKKIKQDNLNNNRELIKLTSDLDFTRQEHNNLELKHRQLQEKCNELKLKVTDVENKRTEQTIRLARQINNYTHEIEYLKNALTQLGTPVKQEDGLFNSIHVSDISFSVQSKRHFEEEVHSLKEKLRQVETAMEIKIYMEKEVENEYKNNLAQIRNEILEKNKEMEKYRADTDKLMEELRTHQLQKKHDDFKQKTRLYEQKIAHLESECTATKQSEEKLNEMMTQMVESVKVREEQWEDLVQELQEKERTIHQLKEVLEMRELKGFSKESKDQTGGVIFSGTDQITDVAELSFFSNISEVFKRDDFIQEKIKRGRSNRDDQAKLFSKTSAYIKSIKTVLQAKQKRIRLLERQITSLKSQHTLKLNKQHYKVEKYNPPTDTLDDIEECNEYRDYDSLQLDSHGFRYVQITKQLQNERDLAVEQNIVLTNQVEKLQDELTKAEEQQTILLQMKDLYKDEIRKLMANNDKHAQDFELQIKKLREEMERSDAYHNWEAIKQLTIKIVSSIGTLDDPACKNNKKDAIRKQLEQYVKVACSVLQMEPGLRDKMVLSIRR